MGDVQPSFTDVEYGQRRRVSRREQFLSTMDATIPWESWLAVIRPFYYDGRKGRKPKPLETMLRMYLLQVWFSLADEAVEDAIYDSYAMRRFVRLDFTVEQVPDATTLLQFRHLLQTHELGARLFAEQSAMFEAQGWMMRGGSIVDATIIAAPTSIKNPSKSRDPEMHATQKGNQMYFGMKAHVGVDAGTGYAHAVTVTAANAADVTQVARLVRSDDEVVYADSGYQGAANRAEIKDDPELSRAQWRVAIRKKKLAELPRFDQWQQARWASIRAKVEHLFLIIKRDFGFTKTRYRGLAKNENLLMVLVASANWLMRARAVALMA